MNKAEISVCTVMFSIDITKYEVRIEIVVFLEIHECAISPISTLGAHIRMVFLINSTCTRT